MPAKALPRRVGFSTVTPYLILTGAPKFIDFVKTAFDATERRRHLDDAGNIKHAEVQVGESIIWLAEALPAWPAMPTGLLIYVDDADATYQRALSAGATSIMPPSDQFYGDRMGGVTDMCGNQWWIATHIEDVSEEELERRSKLAPKH